MTRARSLLIAGMAVAVLIGGRPMAGDEQFPHGLMSADPRGQGGGACLIETRPLVFGAYDPLAEADVDAIGQVIYSCRTNNGNGGGGGGPGTLAQEKGIRIEMDEGYSNSFAHRGMVGPGGRLMEYNIYLDATHRTVFGTGVGSTEVYIDLHPPNLTPTIVPLFGRIFGRQPEDLEAGEYSDILGVRIQF